MSLPSITKDAVVTIHYQLTLDDGSIADKSFGGEPLVYLHGHGNLVPGLETQLLGKQPGSSFEAVVDAAEGYGEFDPGAEGAYPRSAFPKNQKIEPGMMFHTEDEQGNARPLWVKKVETDKVFVSGNHPLAGQRLNFKIEVVSVRKATREELAHGHVHGPGGHHH